MRTSLEFVGKPSLLDVSSSVGPNKVLIVCGHSSVLKKKGVDILKAALPSTVIVPSFVDHLVQGSCSSFNGATSSTMLALGDSSFVRVSFLRIPDTCSRYNCPTRPDVVYDKLPSLLRSANETSGEESSTTLVSVVFVLPDSNDYPYSEKESALSLAGALGRSCPLYSRKKASNSSLSVCTAFYSSERNLFCWNDDTTFLRTISISVDAIREAASLVDQPCNECNTTTMTQRAKDLVESMNSNENVKGTVSMFKCCVGDDLEAEGFGGIFGVGKAASNPPALVVMKYEPKESSETIVWIGKGIVYDTGGLSIKTKTGMPGMKRDMGGSAAILEAFRATCLIGCSKTLYAILCLAENAVGTLATRPDDIHTLYSGVTVEINNTDAEGRLVVGDGVAYASQHLGPDVILDMCTLTGAQGVATGHRHASIVCNDEPIEQAAVVAGRKCGDMCHPMPYCPELFKVEFKSYVADMKNSVKNRNNAQVSCAAQFIATHISEDYANKWIHVDMASPSHKGELATGYGVLLLLQLFVLDQ